LLTSTTARSLQVSLVLAIKTESSGGINKQRFANLSNASTGDIITQPETKNTKENTKLGCSWFLKASFIVVKMV